MELVELMKRDSIDVIARKVVPANNGLIVASVACMACSFLLITIAERNLRAFGEIGKAFLIVLAILFAWGLIQAPLYLVGLGLARINCRKRLSEINTSNRGALVSEFVVEYDDGSTRSVFRSQFGLGTIKRLAFELTVDLQNEQDRSQNGKAFDISKIMGAGRPQPIETIVRILLFYARSEATPVTQKPIDTCLAYLTRNFLTGIQAGDNCVFTLSASGFITGTILRNGAIALKSDIGQIRLMSPLP